MLRKLHDTGNLSPLFTSQLCCLPLVSELDAKIFGPYEQAPMKVMLQLSNSFVIVVVLLIISSHAFNVDSFLRDFFGEEEVDETDPAAYLK